MAKFDRLLGGQRTKEENRRRGRGGKREGAGRPPLQGGRQVQKTINMPPALASAIEASATLNKRSIPKEVVVWLQDAARHKIG